jgi:hypothetical protein
VTISSGVDKLAVADDLTQRVMLSFILRTAAAAAAFSKCMHKQDGLSVAASSCKRVTCQQQQQQQCSANAQLRQTDCPWRVHGMVQCFLITSVGLLHGLAPVAWSIHLLEQKFICGPPHLSVSYNQTCA